MNIRNFLEKNYEKKQITYLTASQIVIYPYIQILNAHTFISGNYLIHVEQTRFGSRRDFIKNYKEI